MANFSIVYNVYVYVVVVGFCDNNAHPSSSAFLCLGLRNFEHWCIKDQQTHPSQKQSVNPKPGAPSIFQSPNKGLKDKHVPCIFKILNMDESKISDHIQIKIKTPALVSRLWHPPKSQI